MDGSFTLDEQVGVAVAFVEGVIRALDLDAAARAEASSQDEVHVAVDGADAGLLLGVKGATLAALQELTRSALQHHTGGHAARITVDVGEYRARRRAALEAFATRVAAEVAESGQERALEAMTALDRRIVHEAVAGVAGATSRSDGEEPRRRVVIFPS